MWPCERVSLRGPEKPAGDPHAVVRVGFPLFSFSSHLSPNEGSRELDLEANVG